jgi:hypothetical protein
MSFSGGNLALEEKRRFTSLDKIEMHSVLIINRVLPKHIKVSNEPKFRPQAMRK